MVFNPKAKAGIILQSLQTLHSTVQKIATANEVRTYDLIRGVDAIIDAYGKAKANYLTLTNSSMTQGQLGSLFADLIYPNINLNSSFSNLDTEYNQFLVSYENDMWPLFEGKLYNRVGGNHILHSVALPSAFKDAAGEFVQSISGLIEV